MDYIAQTTNLLFIIKEKNIRFFTPEDNQLKTEGKAKTQPLPTGYISPAGKIIFPAATLKELGLEPEAMRFQLGTDQGKRKIKTLYLIPTESENAFSIVRTGRGYSLPLNLILSNGGIDFANGKYTFTASIFEHEGAAAYALDISEEQPTEKVPYTGKPRGRRPTSQSEENTL